MDKIHPGVVLAHPVVNLGVAVAHPPVPVDCPWSSFICILLSVRVLYKTARSSS